jgi:hypothetical protein
MLRWLYLTGHAAGGAIWRLHKTLECYDKERVLLNGVAAIGGAPRVKEKDLLNEKLTAPDILGRFNFPCEKIFLEKTEKWLSGLTKNHAVAQVNLFFLEQRMASWAAPQIYGNIYSQFEISPFNHRKIYHGMMKLPHLYWKNKELANDICRKLWPELLELPFNDYTGLKKLISHTGKHINTAKQKSIAFARKVARVVR